MKFTVVEGQAGRTTFPLRDDTDTAMGYGSGELELLTNSQLTGNRSTATALGIRSTKMQIEQLIGPLMDKFGSANGFLRKLVLLVGQAYLDLGEYEFAQDWYAQFVDGGKYELASSLRAEMLKRLGHVASMQCHWEQAESLYTRSLVLFEVEQRYSDMADVYNDLGHNSLQQGDWGSARTHYESAIGCAEQGAMPLACADAHNGLAIIAGIQNDKVGTIRHLQASLSAYEEARHPRGMAQTYQNLALAYADHGHWTAASRCYDAAIELAEEHNELALLGVICMNRAEFLFRRANLSSAKVYCNKALTLYRQMGDILGVAESYRLLGQIARCRQDWEKACDYLQQSVHLFEGSRNPQGMAEACRDFGGLLIEQADLTGAKQFLTQSKTIFSQLGAIEEVKQVEQALLQCA